MRIILSGNLLRFSGFEREVSVSGTTWAEGIDALVARHPALESVLFDSEHRVRGSHKLFVNGEQLASLDALAGEALPDGELAIVTAIAGG